MGGVGGVEGWGVGGKAVKARKARRNGLSAGMHRVDCGSELTTRSWEAGEAPARSSQILARRPLRVLAARSLSIVQRPLLTICEAAGAQDEVGQAGPFHLVLSLRSNRGHGAGCEAAPVPPPSLWLSQLAVGAPGQALMAALTMRLYLSTPAGGWGSVGQKGLPSRGMEGGQAALEYRDRGADGTWAREAKPEGMPSSMLPRQQARLEMAPLVAPPRHLPKAFRMKNGNWLERSTPADVVSVKRWRLLGQAVTRLRTDT